jgi:hypothetical protein
MKLRLCVLTLLVSLTAVLIVAPVAPAARPAQPSASSSLITAVSGTLADGTGLVTGVLNITGFTLQDGVISAVGTLTTTITDAAGNVLATVTQAVSLPLQVTGDCQVLHLDLGPLDLNVLGLVVHLDEVVLDITAQSGPGNLVGNLVCAVAHLLDNPSATLTGVTNLLNVILGNL